MKHASRVRLSLVFFCASLSTGCFGPTRAYLGPRRSADQTATIVPQGVSLLRVNDVEIPVMSSGATVLPGKNVIEFTIDHSNFNSPGPNPDIYTIEMIAQSGVTYAITGERGDSHLCAFPLNESGMPSTSSPAGCAMAPGAQKAVN